MSDPTDIPQETPKAHAAFLAYCEMGIGRSLQKVADKLRQSNGKPAVTVRTLEEWSSQYRWQERVRQYDTEQAERRRQEDEKNRQQDWDTVRKMLLRQIDAEIEASPASQIQAAKLLIEHYVVADDIAQVKAQYEELLKKLEAAGIKL